MKLKIMLILGTFGIFTLFYLPAFAQVSSKPQAPWEMNLPQLESAISHAIQNDHPDILNSGIKDCVEDPQDSSTITCSFKDGPFQKAEVSFMALDAMSSRTTQDLKLRINLVDGKISKLTLLGTRADRANQYDFFGTLVNIFQVFDSNIVANDEEFAMFDHQLGITRNDNSIDIGTAKQIKRDWGTTICVVLPSTITWSIRCVIEKDYNYGQN